MKRYLIYVFIVICFSCFVHGQEQKRTKEIFPSIMVVPRTNENQDLRTLIDDNSNIRIGMASVKDGFDQYGYVTKDFETLFKKTMTDPKVWNYTKDEYKELLRRSITTDIIIELDLMYVTSSSGNLVRVVLEANEVSNANSLGTKTCESNMFYTKDIGSLTISAMNQDYGDESTCFDSFMKEILIKWGKQYEVGKIAVLDFSLDKNSKWTMDSKLTSKDNERLKFVIEDWLNETAYNHYVKIDYVTESKISVGEYRYAFMETTRNIERKLYRFFDKMDIAVKIVTDKESIYVKIL